MPDKDPLSISGQVVAETYRKHYDTHGNLTATLVNQEDPSDSVVLDLDL